MSNQFFRCKKFTVYHDRCAMKVGTDAMLLGAWTDIADSKRVLDIGTGSGLISIMIAQRNELAKIDAVEIDFDSYKQAGENFANCLWSNRLTLVKDSFQNFAETSETQYDTIVSNPPYFINLLKSPKNSKNIAKHTDSLSYSDLVFGVNKIITKNGKFCVILPTEMESIFLTETSKYQFFVTRKTYVVPKPTKASNRVLLELKKESIPVQISDIQIETEIRHQYSEEFKTLLKDFYLAF